MGRSVGKRTRNAATVSLEHTRVAVLAETDQDLSRSGMAVTQAGNLQVLPLTV